MVCLRPAHSVLVTCAGVHDHTLKSAIILGKNKWGSGNVRYALACRDATYQAQTINLS